MRVSILPKTSPGRWSIGIAAAVILLILLNILLGPNTLNVLEFRSGSVELRIFFVIHCVFGVGALVTGLISIIKSKERSILTYLALVVGLYTLLFIYLFITGSQW